MGPTQNFRKTGLRLTAGQSARNGRTVGGATWAGVRRCPGGAAAVQPSIGAVARQQGGRDRQAGSDGPLRSHLAPLPQRRDIRNGPGSRGRGATEAQPRNRQVPSWLQRMPAPPSGPSGRCLSQTRQQQLRIPAGSAGVDPSQPYPLSGTDSSARLPTGQGPWAGGRGRGRLWSVRQEPCTTTAGASPAAEQHRDPPRRCQPPPAAASAPARQTEPWGMAEDRLVLRLKTALPGPRDRSRHRSVQISTETATGGAVLAGRHSPEGGSGQPLSNIGGTVKIPVGESGTSHWRSILQSLAEIPVAEDRLSQAYPSQFWLVFVLTSIGFVSSSAHLRIDRTATELPVDTTC